MVVSKYKRSPIEISFNRKTTKYNVQIDMEVLEVELNKKIVFQWDANGEGHIATISLKELDNSSTLIEVNEEGFKENDDELISQLLDIKEGWVFMLTCLKNIWNSINNLTMYNIVNYEKNKYCLRFKEV
ncbi:SRPBCC domain-containing protein [Peribacillus sp. NPDC096540]|uniref:SRPBCC domain-containing protein n=1 Tax=Peribacillus sp. NPDC096540 TaxID=3390612 RepID=UPI003D067843